MQDKVSSVPCNTDNFGLTSANCNLNNRVIDYQSSTVAYRSFCPTFCKQNHQLDSKVLFSHALESHKIFFNALIDLETHYISSM